jgi:hypothetical protein
LKQVKCPHCKRVRNVRKATSQCPCGFKPVPFWVRLSRAISGVTGKPYKPRNRKAKELVSELCTGIAQLDLTDPRD